MWCAFEKPAAAERKQGIADKTDIARQAVVNDMATGMSRCIVNRKRPGSQPDRIPFGDSAVDPRDSFCIRGRPDDLTPSLRFQLQVAPGMIVVVMPQTYFQLREAGEIEPGILAFWPRYITGWDIAGIAVPTWNHLWYVVYLFVYALLLAPLMGLLKAFGRGPGALLGRIWDSRFGPMALIALGFAPMMVYRVFLVPHFETTHNLTWDWANHAISFTYLLYGVFAAKSERFWSVIDRALPLALGLTIALGVVLTPVWALWWDQVAEHDIALWLARAGRVLYAWTMILTLLGLARRFLNGDGPVRRYLTEAIFPVYILHQTITVSAGYALTRLGLDVWTEFVLVTVITYAGAFAGFEIIRRIKPLRPLFGLKL